MSRFVKATHTERGLDRLINFSDAVVAIAATLLILPIVEGLNDTFSPEGDGLSISGLAESGSQAWTFVFGFLTMFVCWIIHHDTFERVKDYSSGLIVLNFLWLIAMVFFAFPVGFLYDPNREVAALMAATLGAILVVLTGTRVYLLRRPELMVDPPAKVGKSSYFVWFLPAAVMFVTALAVLVFGQDFIIFFVFAIPMARIAQKYGLPAPTHTERGMDRLVNFADAVVAIAVTLLILPLVDIITDDRVSPSGDLVLGSFEVVAKVVTFVFTFWVMSRFWLANHRVFENVKDYSAGLIGRTVLWLLLMVLLALPSALIGQEMGSALYNTGLPLQGVDNLSPENFYVLASLLFGFIIALIALFTGGIASYAKRHQELLVDPTQPLSPRENYYEAAVFLVIGAAPLVLTRIGYESLIIWSWVGVFALLPFIRKLAGRQDIVKPSSNDTRS